MELVVIILLLLVLIGLYIISLWIKARQKKNTKLVLALAYERLVMKHKLSIEHVEVLDNRIIALDRKNKQLLFLNHNAGSSQEVAIPLIEIATCRIFEDRDEQRGYIRSVYLELVPKVGSKTYLLNFYDERSNKPTALVSAIRRARNWKQRVEVNKNPGAVTLESEYVL